MKQSVQILLLFACSVSLLAEAREETMAERKARITRKYLQKRVEITQSEMVVPDAAVENEEDVLASEKFKDAQVDLQRQEPGTRMPPPSAPRPRPRAAANRNWLLADAPEEEEDADTNPFSLKSTKAKPAKQTDWSAWGTERDSSSPYTVTENESRFNWRNSGTSRQGGLFGSQETSTEGLQPGFQSQQYPGLEGSSLFGRQQQEARNPYPTGGLDLSRDKTVDPTLNQNPFLRTPARSAGQSSNADPRKQQGYIPYKSPYQTQRNQQQQQWGGTTEPRQEYRKQDPFLKWKEQNPHRNDPMRDDAFITEMMPKTRR